VPREAMPLGLRFLTLGITFAIVSLLTVIYKRPLSHSTETIAPLATAMSSLKLLTVSPAIKHSATVIFVHGLGDSGHGWKPVADVGRHRLTSVYLKITIVCSRF
jgi:pimeloyl-ACP methyl ester carboxylesterase